MPIAWSSETNADADAGTARDGLNAVLGRRDFALTGVSALLTLGACTKAAAPVASGPPAQLPPPLPFDQAVLEAANKVLSSARGGSTADATAPPGATRQLVVIDPLVDGVTGEQ